jgi:DNA-binding transcriptional LysR family regulator
MELRYLEIFCKVVEHGSFSKAAEALRLTQPTVSIHIKALEDEFKTRFLDRLGRSVVPTRAGQILYRYARDIVRLKEEAEGALGEFSGMMRGALTVGASTIPGEYILPSLITRFKKHYPHVVPTLRVGDTKDIYGMVLEGEVDVGVVGHGIKDRNLISKSFLDDELVLVAPASFEGSEVTNKGLKKLPILLREMGSGTRATLESALKKNGIDIDGLNLSGDMGSTRALIEAVKSGMGLSFISRRAVKEDISRGLLKPVNVKGLRIKRNFHIITHRLRANSTISRAFIEFLSKHP